MCVGHGQKTADRNSERRVYQCLKAATVDYRFRPGEQIMVGELAERLRVSSTPVRETLICLQSEELLETTRRRGFFAKTLNLKEMVDLLQLRFLILQSSIEQTFAFSSKALRRGVKAIPRATTAANDPGSGDHAAHHLAVEASDDAVRSIERISEAVVALSQNEVMLRTLANLNDRTHYVRMIDLETEERSNVARSMIGDLLAAMRRNDADGAIAILKRACDEQVARMPALVKEGISRAYTSPSWIQALSQVEACATALGRPITPARAADARR